jgi:hypothetical protein
MLSSRREAEDITDLLIGYLMGGGLLKRESRRELLEPILTCKRHGDLAIWNRAFPFLLSTSRYNDFITRVCSLRIPVSKDARYSPVTKGKTQWERSFQWHPARAAWARA